MTKMPQPAMPVNGERRVSPEVVEATLARRSMQQALYGALGNSYSDVPQPVAAGERMTPRPRSAACKCCGRMIVIVGRLKFENRRDGIWEPHRCAPPPSPPSSPVPHDVLENENSTWAKWCVGGRVIALVRRR
jgi:hypothetical protein